jgi:ABC-type nitrate/sulfonate/bicarbonate transport system permease component
MTTTEPRTQARQPAPATPRRSYRRFLAGFNYKGLLFVVFVIAAWQVLKVTGVISSEYIPSPQNVYNAAADLIREGGFFGPLLHTAGSTVLGWAIASVIGVGLGIAMANMRWLWVYSMASVDVLRSIPAITFVPVVVLIFGFSVKAELILIVYVSIWPIMLSTLHGLLAVSQAHRDVARMMRLPRADVIRKIVLPSATPEIVVGLRLGMALSLTLAVVSELLGNPQGLGYALSQQENNLNPARMFVFVILIGLLGFVFNAILVRVARVALPGARAGRGANR